jgi:hypothetical protein
VHDADFDPAAVATNAMVGYIGGKTANSLTKGLQNKILGSSSPSAINKSAASVKNTAIHQNVKSGWISSKGKTPIDMHRANILNDMSKANFSEAAQLSSKADNVGAAIGATVESAGGNIGNSVINSGGNSE